MIFSKNCNSYLQSRLMSSAEEDSVLCAVRKNLPISTSSINWAVVKDAINKDNVNEKQLLFCVDDLVKKFNMNLNDIFNIINLNDAFPPLKSNLSSWFDFIDELGFPDTIFFSENLGLIIHWDFYRDLHAKFIGDLNLEEQHVRSLKNLLTP